MSRYSGFYFLNKYISEELSRLIWFIIIYKFATEFYRLQIFQTMNSVKIKSLKYQRFTTSGCKGIRFEKFD